MRRLSLCHFVTLSLCYLLFPSGITHAEDKAGFVPLFDGKTLSGWDVKAEKPGEAETWSVKDGVLAATPGANWLGTKREYGNFVLRLKWRIPENGNSGVFVRVPPLAKGEQPHEKGIEIQVLDDKGSQFAGKLKPWQYAGSIYGAVPAENSTFKGAEQWNEYQITCRGDILEVQMNGRVVAAGNVTQIETLKSRPRRGAIGLQNHGTAVEYKEIEIKELE
jgi:hypothetical protein